MGHSLGNAIQHVSGSAGTVTLPGRYYDGRQPIGSPATLIFAGREAAPIGTCVSQRYAVGQLRVSPRVGRADRFISLPDGGQLQCDGEGGEIKRRSAGRAGARNRSCGASPCHAPRAAGFFGRCGSRHHHRRCRIVQRGCGRASGRVGPTRYLREFEAEADDFAFRFCAGTLIISGCDRFNMPENV